MLKSLLRRINPSKTHNEKHAGWMDQEKNYVLERFCLLRKGSEWCVGCPGRQFVRVMFVVMHVCHLSVDALKIGPTIVIIGMYK